MTLSTPTVESPVHPTRHYGRSLPTVLVLLLVLGGLSIWGWWFGTIGSIPVRPRCTATATGATAELTPEQASNAAVIIGIAARRGLPARAATIAIATALQESKLINLSGGDRDSVGLFQQRPSQGWGTAEQVYDPVYATNAFYDALIKIPGYEKLSITVAAQRVQRSAFPTAYAAHEPEARLWASTLTGYTPAGLTCVLPEVSAKLPEGKLGKDHLTDRARTAKTAARQELGRTAVPSGNTGSVLRFGAAPKEPGRQAWTVAQWAVARAHNLQVTEVETEGRRWRRDRPAEGWTPKDDGPPPGEVLIRIG